MRLKNLFFICLIFHINQFMLMDVIDFEKQVLPILQDRCIECHKAPFEQNGRVKKPKAGLRLDGPGHIIAGSDDGLVVVVDHPSQSSLYQRIILPSDDDDIMPPKGDPLSFQEKEIIRKWIAQGLDFGRWVGATDGIRQLGRTDTVDHELPQYLLFYDRLASGLSPLGISRLTHFQFNSSLIVRSIGQQNPLIEVRAVTDGAGIDDKVILRLSELGDHLTHLDLRNTNISDKSLSTISIFKNLSKLNIRATNIGDEGIVELLNMPNLKSLNISETKVSGKSLKSLLLLNSLVELTIWNCQIPKEEIENYKQTKPMVNVNF
jgi:hypothetical protein